MIAIASTVAGAAGSLISSAGAAAAANKQKQAYEQWAQEQHANRVAAQAKDEQDRQMAEAARQQGLQDVGADKQKSVQASEEERLKQYLSGSSSQPADQAAGATPATSVTDRYLASSNDPQFKADLASRIDKANAEAKQRTDALAAVSSYGGSSQGLDRYTADAFQRSGQGIDLANEFRRGDLGAYRTAQAVDPLQYTYTPGPGAEISSQLLQYGAKGIGTQLAPGGSLAKLFTGATG